MHLFIVSFLMDAGSTKRGDKPNTNICSDSSVNWNETQNFLVSFNLNWDWTP